VSDFLIDDGREGPGIYQEIKILDGVDTSFDDDQITPM
jgi:hypothetical protein